MSETAARPWWAEVEHLKPPEDRRPPAAPAPATPHSGRFDREAVARASGGVAMLERPTAEPVTASLEHRDAEQHRRFPGRPHRGADEAPSARSRRASDDARPPRSRRSPDEAPPSRSRRSAEEAPPARSRRSAVEAHARARPVPAPEESRPRPARAETDLRPRGAAFAEYRDGRRTVAIRGQVDRATAPVPAAASAGRPGDRRRSRRSAVDRLGSSPDRVALWAVLLGLLLILVAALSTPGAAA